MAQSHSHTHTHSGRGRHATTTHENGAVTQERYQKLKRKVRDMQNVSSFFILIQELSNIRIGSQRKYFHERKLF